MRIITFRTYHHDEVQAQTEEEFTTSGTFREWVWHDAPSKAAAIARHEEAFSLWYKGEIEVFDHSNPNPGWDHAFDLNLLGIISRQEDASDVTGAQIREKLQALLHLSDEDLLAECNLIDTIREGK